MDLGVREGGQNWEEGGGKKIEEMEKRRNSERGGKGLHYLILGSSSKLS